MKSVEECRQDLKALTNDVHAPDFHERAARLQHDINANCAALLARYEKLHAQMIQLGQVRLAESFMRIMETINTIEV